ncbi:MAG: hypothetical protein GXN92_01135 [Candidatus Micrarchaeota archaeon]|nr:hypothetical protein [Candidatus Micrarchaeota archaeon]
MGRGREPLVTCDACGRTIPRDKAVEYSKGIVFDVDQKDIVLDLTRKKVYYCISCAKHRKIFEKKKKRLRKRYD